MVAGKQARRRSFLSFAILTLALWQVKRSWFLLLIITLGMISAVVIVCTLPLLSDVMTTSGLRSTLRATPDSAHIMVNTQSNGASSAVVQNVHEQFDTLLHQYLGTVAQPTESALISSDFSFYPARKSTSLNIYGTSISQMARYLGPVQGRLAQSVSGNKNELELMMTPDTAKQLHTQVGSSFKVSLQYTVLTANSGLQERSAIIPVRVAGLFNVTTPNAPSWHGEDFKPLQTALEGSSVLSQYTLLASDQALLSLFDRLSSSAHTDAVHSKSYLGYTMIWHYQLDASHLASKDLDSLIGKLDGLQAAMDSLHGDLETGMPPDAFLNFPYLTHANLSSPVLSSSGESILDQFRSRVAVVRIPAGVFTILISALVLFFISLMTTLLIDRQTETLALLRSRGASGSQIFCALLLQSVVLGALALLVGLVLTFFIVLLLAQRLLPAAALDALNIISSQPVQAVLGTIWYALTILLLLLFTMSLSLFATARTDVLALRRETARSNKRPFWQRFYLDVIAGVIALTGYGFLLYVTSVGSELQGNTQVLVTGPLSIIAPFFLLIGALFLFLRVFPWLLRLGTHLAARGRGAVSLLALAQMARAPRQSLRMTLLLALATAFALFTLVYTATQNQHVQDIVTYQTGADFSLQLQPLLLSQPEKVISQYQAIPGVLSTSAGYSDSGYGGTANLPMEVRAVDAATFGRTVIWPSPQVAQAARPLLNQLVSFRSGRTLNATIPAIVDRTVINKLLLHVGSSFTIKVNNAAPNVINCFIAGVVEQVPTINTLFATNSITPVTTGGVLIDYQSYLKAYQFYIKEHKTPANSINVPSINRVWLRTTDSPGGLASIRTTLSQPGFHFASLVDRRLLLSTLQSDPLYLVLDGILTIGTITALLLALIGGLLVSWVSARTRLINIVTLRALGSAPGQVTGMFAWEQAIVSLMGCILGGSFGVLLATSVIPALTFTDLNSNLSQEQFFAMQSALAAKIVVPPSLPVLGIAILALYIVSLILMTGTVLRPTLGRMLRVNED